MGKYLVSGVGRERECGGGGGGGNENVNKFTRRMALATIGRLRRSRGHVDMTSAKYKVLKFLSTVPHHITRIIYLFGKVLANLFLLLSN